MRREGLRSDVTERTLMAGGVTPAAGEALPGSTRRS
jgi:hypothetical protein